MSDTSQLPPLILHPFSGGKGTDELLDGSNASLALQGLIPSTDEASVLQTRMLTGRFHEVRMLLFLGKDVFRWLQQCVEHVRQADARIVEQSFASLLVENPPEPVKHKLEKWGVTDRRSIFSRAIGVHSMLREPPPASALSPIFLEHYHRYADHAYICYQHLTAFPALETQNYRFEIYASEEYARLLSDQWDQK